MFDSLLFPLRRIGPWLVFGSAIPIWVLLAIIRFLLDYEPLAGYMAIFFLLPALYVFVGALVRYALIILVYTARGHDQPPDVDVPDLNPMALAHIAMLIIAAVAVASLVLSVPDGTAARPLLIGSAIVLGSPLVTLAGLNDGLPGAATWRESRRLVAGLGIESLGLLLVGSAWAMLAAAICTLETGLVTLIVTTYLFLLAHRLAGRLLYRHRLDLDLSTEISPEQTVAAESAATHAQFKDLLVELHRLCNTDRVDEAYRQLETYLASENGPDEASVHLSLKDFHDSRLRLEYSYHYIDRLIERRDRIRAWQVLYDSVGEDPAFRPSSDEVLISLLANAPPEHADAVETLLADFETRFPGSHLTANALFRLAVVRIEQLQMRADGLAILDRIATEFPQFANQQRYLQYRRTIGVDRPTDDSDAVE